VVHEVTKEFRLPSDELEYDVLAKLWELGTASIRELHDQLGQEGLGYSTTAKVVERLGEKGLIERHLSGYLFIYRPRVAREEVEGARARKAVSRLFGAAPHAAVAALVEAVDAVDPKLLDELERLVIARRRAKDGA
jgi:predicted transcriptional regulator